MDSAVELSGAGRGGGCSCSESKGNEEVRGHSTGSLQTEHVQLPTVQAVLRKRKGLYLTAGVDPGQYSRNYFSAICPYHQSVHAASELPSKLTVCSGDCPVPLLTMICSIIIEGIVPYIMHLPKPQKMIYLRA